MSKTNIAIITYFTVFVVPMAGYIVVNFYWWLFDGNVLNGDKMAGAFIGLVITGFVGAFLLAEVWK